MRALLLVTCTIALLAAGCDRAQSDDSGSSPSRATQPASSGACEDCRAVELKGCYDGDTCRFSSFDKRVRLARIDTPEMDGPCREEAKAARRALLERLRGASTLCVTKTGVGSYGRPIGEVCTDGDNVNNWLMEEGYAVDYGKPTCPRGERGSRPQDEGSSGSSDDEGSSGAESGDRDGPCSAADVDCSELDSCEEARRYYDPCPGDPHRLDGNDDGTPCESLCR